MINNTHRNVLFDKQTLNFVIELIEVLLKVKLKLGAWKYKFSVGLDREYL